jgi:O2-independent ubiquinone biosynthesis accessory factor UbiT
MVTGTAGPGWNCSLRNSFMFADQVGGSLHNRHLMNQAYVVPPPLGRMLSLLPVFPGSLLFSTGLNLALSRHLPGDLCEALKDKRLRIEVTDACLHFNFLWNGRQFVPCSAAQLCDLSISATFQDFVLLARRQVDPDTLFFSRRLAIGGDTELGLRVKNALDAIDFDFLADGGLGLRAIVRRVGGVFCRGGEVG